MTTSSPFVVNITWDSSVGSAPNGFTAGVIAAVQYLESQITDPVNINININIDVGYGEVAGSTLGSGVLGESETYLTSVGYSALVSALKTDATSATDASVLASLPATSPVNGTYWVSTAQAKALGLAPTHPSTGMSDSRKRTRSPTTTAAAWRREPTISTAWCCTRSPRSWAA